MMKTQPLTYHAQLFINGEFSDAASGVKDIRL